MYIVIINVLLIWPLLSFVYPLEFHKSVWPASGVPTITYSISQECTRCVTNSSLKDKSGGNNVLVHLKIFLTYRLWLSASSPLVPSEDIKL